MRQLFACARAQLCCTGGRSAATFSFPFPQHPLAPAPLPVTRAGLYQEVRQGACVQLLDSSMLWNSHRKHDENGSRKDIYDKWKVLLCRVWLEGGSPDGSVPSAAGSRYVHT